MKNLGDVAFAKRTLGCDGDLQPLGNAFTVEFVVAARPELAGLGDLIKADNAAVWLRVVTRTDLVGRVLEAGCIFATERGGFGLRLRLHGGRPPGGYIVIVLL